MAAMMARCWHCEKETAASEVLLLAVLVPRTASDGGPGLLFRCRRCDVDGLVERNAAGEVLLSPPLVLRFPSATLVGDALYAARKWIAEHGENRRQFLAARSVSRANEPEPDAATPPASGAEPTAIREDAPEPDTAVDLTGVTSILEAYEILCLPLTASAETVRERYHELARKCHPDRVADLDREIRLLAERKFRRLTRAYELAMENLRSADPRVRRDSR